MSVPGRGIRRAVPVWIVSMVLASVHAHAQPVPLGDEFIVNTFTSGGQGNPAIARDATGNFVIVWGSAPEPPSVYKSVRGQRYDSAGSPVGTEFQVETSVRDADVQPDVAMASDGSFVVVWKDYDEYGYPNVAERAYDSDGLPRGDPFWVGSFDAGSLFGYYYRSAPAVAADSDDQFVVVWSGGDRFLGYFGYNNYLTVLGRRLDSTGTPQGTNFPIAGSGREYWAARPNVSAGKPGEFVVVWSGSSYDYGYDEHGYYRIRTFGTRARRIADDGTVTADILHVGSGGYWGAAVGADAAGNFIVTWPSYESEDSGYALSGRRYTSDGTALGIPFRISALPTVGVAGSGRTNAGVYGSDVTVTDDGHFVSVWAEGGNYQGSSDGSSLGIFARSYEPDGTPLGGEIQVNAYTTNIQSAPAVVATGADDLVAVWDSKGQDGDSWGVVARPLRRWPDCGDATADGELTATDALDALRTAVGSAACAACICDSNGSGGITATDALDILRAATGQQVALVCGSC